MSYSAHLDHQIACESPDTPEQHTCRHLCMCVGMYTLRFCVKTGVCTHACVYVCKMQESGQEDRIVCMQVCRVDRIVCDPLHLHAHMLSTLHTFLHTSCRPYTPACTHLVNPPHLHAHNLSTLHTCMHTTQSTLHTCTQSCRQDCVHIQVYRVQDS